VGAVVAAAALLWLKEAGVGLVIGLALWLILRRAWRKAALTIAGVSALFAPVVIGRAVAGTPLIGSRYSNDFGSYYAGGLWHRIVHVLPGSFATFVSTALPSSVVPTGSPLSSKGLFWYALDVLRWTVAPLVLVGMIAWLRNHRDAAVVMVLVYVLSILTYPFINERRVILVLPPIVAWYVLGALTAGRLIGALTQRTAGHAMRVVMAAVVIVPVYALIEQFPRDYLFGRGQTSSDPKGSPYMGLLSALGQPRNVVETSYRFTTALYSGHRTANNAFVVPCDPVAVADAVGQDKASLLLSAALNKPGLVDSDCVLGYASSQPWAVRLYRTGRDMASVFAVGPGVTDLATGTTVTSAGAPVLWTPEAGQSPSDQPGQYPSVLSDGTGADLTWSLAAPEAVGLVTLGAAAAEGGTRGGVTVDLLGLDGQWRPIASSATAVGDGTPTPWLLGRFNEPVPARAIRVRVAGLGRIDVHDLHILGASL
jgi:hypothetical protein